MRNSLWTLAAASWLFATPVFAHDIPIIDAHSQADHEVDLADIVPLLDRAGVSRVILASRSKRHWRDIAQLAARHPDRVTASVRTKGRRFVENHAKFYKLLKKQLGTPQFAAMAEVILWHAQKGHKAAEVIVHPADPQAQAALEATLKRGWPFVPHIEFAAAREAGDYDRFMKALKAMLDAHPDHPFALTHMAQLSAAEAGALLAAHRNIHFIMSHANPVVVSKSKQPWVDLFDGGAELSPQWRALVLRYPDRFIVGFDNVWAEHWGSFFTDQVALWRKAFANLPHDVAHAIAHKNAERLWRLPPAKFVKARE